MSAYERATTSMTLGSLPEPFHAAVRAKDALIGTHGEKRGTAALAVRLEDADVSQLSEKLAALGGVLPDDGMSVNGFPGSGAEGGRGSLYFGLGPPEGGAARTALIEAIRAAKA